MEQESRDFRDFCDMALDPIQITTPEGRFVYVNRAWCNTLGYPAAALPEFGFSEILSSEGRKLWQAAVSKLAPDGPAKTLHLQLKGREHQVPVVATLSGRFAGKVLQVVRAVFRPTGASEDPEAELDRLFNLSLDLLCVAGIDGYFKKINPAFQKVLGYAEEELLACSFLEFVHPDDQADTQAQVDRLAQGLPVVDFQNRYRAKDGTYHWLAWRSAPLPGMGLVYAVARDITEQRNMHELLVQKTTELARSNEDLDRFASVASHDLQAPLRAIRNLAEWIAEEIPGQLPEGVQANLSRLHQQVQRMEDMTDDLLEFARTGRDDREIDVVNTGKLVGEIVQMLSLPERFQIRVASEMPMLATQKPALEQVFRNLIVNAIKHHDRPDGVIEIDSSEENEFYRFRVRDDGPGISEEFHEQVFQMFRRLKLRDAVEGTGIGLALVKRIVEHHGGTIHLTSEGRGTTFIFTWPKETSLPDE